MAKTKIEWADYSVNPVKGYCPVGCEYCYARRMYDRFKWDKTIRYILPGFTIAHLQTIKKPSRIFWGSTFELFHECVPNVWLQDTFKIVEQFPQHTHIFLTKQPQNLAKWQFPENCWVGVSATDNDMALDGMLSLAKIKARVKFVSFEPLHGPISFPYKISFGDLTRGQSLISVLNWLIIGSETGNRKDKPPLEQVQDWAREIIKAADEAGIPCFTKDNLKLPANEVRREWPKP